LVAFGIIARLQAARFARVGVRPLLAALERIASAGAAAPVRAPAAVPLAAVPLAPAAPPALPAARPPAPPPMAAAGWLADPSARHELRFWDGARWTDHVTDAGAPAVDPA
jgi:hypothetical protein